METTDGLDLCVQVKPLLQVTRQEEEMQAKEDEPRRPRSGSRRPRAELKELEQKHAQVPAGCWLALQRAGRLPPVGLTARLPRPLPAADRGEEPAAVAAAGGDGAVRRGRGDAGPAGSQEAELEEILHEMEARLEEEEDLGPAAAGRTEEDGPADAGKALRGLPLVVPSP